jgi:TPR repeat protein
VFILKKISLLILSCFVTFSSLYARGYADTEVLDANQHVIMFERGVDAFMAGEYDKCDDYWLPLARAGDPMAARNIALLYHHGKGVRKDLEEAELFYRLAADNGVTEAQTVLGTLLIKGDEFKRNLSDAIKYLTAAHQAGDPIAAWNLGLLYENGIGVDKNLEKAMSLFQLAARSGHEPAILRISGQPQDGYQPPRNVSKAIQGALNNDPVFDTRKTPVVPEQKTFKQKVTIDKKHDQKHYSDQIHFKKPLQSDEPDLIFKEDRGLHVRKQVGIAKALDPLGVELSKVNRLDQPLTLEGLDKNNVLIKADQAYNGKKYGIAKKIWEKTFKESTNDEAAYRLGMLYSSGKGVKKDLFKTYYYWKKGADASGKKSTYALEEFRVKLSDKELLEYEQKTM